MDDPVAFQVVGLRPGQAVTLRASWRMAEVLVTSEARFEAGPSGEVTPRSQPSLAGTYTGEDAYGLWWSARPETGETARPSGLDPVATTLAATCDDGQVVCAPMLRRWLSPQVLVAPLAEGGLVGLSFVPGEAGTFPGVIVLGGSMGGLAGADVKAALLASRGIASLAMAYFGCEGLPPALAAIPLEYLHAGVKWLRDQPHVSGGRVGVLGASRGAELALLLAATHREIACVVAAAPSSVVWGGVGPGVGPGAPAWTIGGRPVPAMRPWRPEVLAQAWARDPVHLAPMISGALDEEDPATGVEIPVERSSGPILLVTGDDDAMWPSGRMAEAIKERATARRLPHRVQHLRYPEAGHLCSGPPGIPSPIHVVHPLDGRRYAMGGTPSGNARAAADSWARTLEFLRGSLTPSECPVVQSTP